MFVLSFFFPSQRQAYMIASGVICVIYVLCAITLFCGVKEHEGKPELLSVFPQHYCIIFVSVHTHILWIS